MHHNCLRPTDLGIIMSYQCQCACKHCLYNCGPRWKDWMSPEILRDNGYVTAAFVSDKLVGEEIGLDQGFAEFHMNQVPHSCIGDRDMEAETKSFVLVSKWLREHRGSRFFLWLECQHPH